MTTFHEYVLNNGDILQELTTSSNNLLDISKPPVYLGNKTIISKDGSTAFVTSLKNINNQYIGNVFIYSFNTTDHKWEYVTNVYDISNSDLTDHGPEFGKDISQFGTSGICCSSNGTRLAVGATKYYNEWVKGAIYIYEKTGSGWVYRERHLGSGGNFGRAMCCDDQMNKLFVGQNKNVHLFEKNLMLLYHSQKIHHLI